MSRDEENRVVALQRTAQGSRTHPNEECLAEFGPNAEDFERTGQTLLEPLFAASADSIVCRGLEHEKTFAQV